MKISHKRGFNYRAFVSIGLFFALTFFITAILIQFFEDDPDSLKNHISLSCYALAGILFIILKLIESGIIKVVLDKVYPFEQTNEALEYIERGPAKGKVVVKIKESQNKANFMN